MQTTTIQRISRALHDRLLCLNEPSLNTYTIKNETGGTIYTVSKIHSKWSCSCSDFKFRHLLCKHIIFVVIRILRTKTNDLSKLFNVSSDELIQLTQHRSKRVLVPQRPLDESCPICFEDMNSNSEGDGDSNLIYCKGGCGKSVHTTCFEQWREFKSNKPQCVWCRAKWID